MRFGWSPVKVSVELADSHEAGAIAALRRSTSEQLTLQYGRGHWSSCPTEPSVVRDIKNSRVLAARRGNAIVGTLCLGTKKPWAIDLKYFTAVPRAVYLHSMAVTPDYQRCGIGRRLLVEAGAIARAWPSHAIRLDAYDADAGAGGFYAKCGFREVGKAAYRNTPLVYYQMLL